MALKNSDLFLVSQHEGANSYTDKKITFNRLKENLGVVNATQETVELDGTINDGEAGLMYPDASFDYDQNSGRLSIPLDARGVNFVDTLSSNNLDIYPSGSDKSGDFYIVEEADLQISVTKWLGIDSDGTGVDATGAVDDEGEGYSINNGTITVIGIKVGGAAATIDVGEVELTVVNGKVTAASHIATSNDLTGLELLEGIFEFPLSQAYGFDESAQVQVTDVLEENGETLITFRVINEGLGYRDNTVGLTGALTNALAVPSDGDESRSFNIDVTIDDNKVISIDSIRLVSGHSDGDTFTIKPGYNHTIANPASFTLTLDSDEEFATVQINDKLIKRNNGLWKILPDELAKQAVLTIENALDLNGDNATEALHIEQKVSGDPRFLTISIDTVTDSTPGLMPPDIFNQIGELPDFLAGGTIVDIITLPEASVDDLSDGQPHVSSDNNPIIAEDKQIDSHPTDLIKNVELSVGRAKVISVGGDPIRVRGTVYIANFDELTNAIEDPSGYNNTSNEVYDFAVSVGVAGDLLMPRNMERLVAKTEDYGTAKRVKAVADKYEVKQGGFVELNAELTYQNGTPVADPSVTYNFEWQGTEYLDSSVSKVVGTTQSLIVHENEFEGPVNFTCKVTETTDQEFQELTDSVYVHFSGLPSGEIDPPDTEDPYMGTLTLTGPVEVILEEDPDLNLIEYLAKVTGGTATDITFTFSSSDEDIARIKYGRDLSEEVVFEFIAEGNVTLEVYARSESADESKVATLDVVCKTLESSMPSLTLRSYDFENDDKKTKIEHILSLGQYSSDIVYTLTCDDPSVTITPIETNRVASNYHTHQIEVPSEGTYTFTGTAYHADNPDGVVSDSIDVTWVPAGTNTPSGSYIHFKAYALQDDRVGYYRLHVTPASMFKKFNYDTMLWETLGVKDVQDIKHGGSVDTPTEWWVDSTNITHFKFERLNGGSNTSPEIEFDETSTVPSLTSLEESFKNMNQEYGNTHFKLNWIDTQNVTNMKATFSGARIMKNDVSITGWDVSNVTNMQEAFRSNIMMADIRNWNTSNVVNMQWIFYQSGSSSGINYWTPEASATYWKFDSVTNLLAAWRGVKNRWYNWSQGAIDAWNTPNLKQFGQMLEYDNKSPEYAKQFDFSSMCAVNNTDSGNDRNGKWHGWWSKNNSTDIIPTDRMPQWNAPCDP